MTWFLLVVVISTSSGSADLVRPDVMFETEAKCEAFLPFALQQVQRRIKEPSFSYAFCITGPTAKGQET